jgi:hypothetical protein
MSLKSCQNCAFNPLQYGRLGIAVGDSVEHQRLLQDAEHTTCGRLLRKDLQLASAEAEAAHHSARFPLDEVVRLRRSGGHEPAGAHAATAVPEPPARPRKGAALPDPVLSTVTEYGELGSKIESLAALRRVPGPRAALARYALGRAYVRRCRLNRGAWTAGLHQLWWALEELDAHPEVQLTDLRSAEPAVALTRQVELAAWSLVMLRLTFVADVATNAAGADPEVAPLAGLPEQAAAAAGTDLSKLLRWTAREGRRLADAALPRARYQQLARRLHVEAETGAA